MTSHSLALVTASECAAIRAEPLVDGLAADDEARPISSQVAPRAWASTTEAGDGLPERPCGVVELTCDGQEVV